ncbi:MAG: glycosyltransferase [Bdellovibrionales bacterium]|nr:glycosyltransferase [Bdellovibrionales bacterium]
MLNSIVYLQDQHPNLTETFVSAEISELGRRSFPVAVVTKQINEQYLQNIDYNDRLVEVPRSGDEQTDIQNLIETVKQLQPAYIHSHFVTECNGIGFPVAKALGIPFGFTVHAYDIWLRGARVEPETLNALGNHPLCVTAASEGTKHKQYLLACGIPEHKLILTPNSVDQKRLPSERKAPPREIKRLVAVGRPVPKKGFFVAIDAVRLLRLQGYDVTLEIIGGADPGKPLGPVVAQYASHFPFVTACPMVSNKEAIEKIRSADALLMPSIIAENGDSDGIPTVMAEAMLMGVPVIATDVGSITDLIIHEQTGFISRSGDPASLAEQLLKLDTLLKDQTQAVAFLERAFKHVSGQQEIQASVNVLEHHLTEQIPGLRR